MDRKHFNVLFLCTGNSARSVLAEAYLNSVGRGRFKGYSAGSKPGGRVNPFALELLDKSGIETAGLRSKNWDEFAQPGAVEGGDEDKRRAFRSALSVLSTRINLFINLPIEKLDRIAIKKSLDDIGTDGRAR